MSHRIFVLLLFFFLLLNTLVLISAILLSSFFSGKRQGAMDWKKFILTTSLFYFLLIFSSEIVLGSIGQLSFAYIWWWHESILLILIFVAWRWKWEIPTILIPKSLLEPIFFACLFFLPWLIILGMRFGNALFQIPLEYDSLAYHLPFIAKWIQTGSIWEPYYSAFSGPIGFYPSNFELFELWAMLPFHSDWLVNLVNLPIFFLFALAMYSVCRKLKISIPLSMGAVALFLFMPQTFRQMGVPLVDIFFCYGFAMALYFLAEYYETRRHADFFLLGAALGIFIGTKYLGVPYAVPILLAGFFLMLFQKKNPLTHHFPSIILGSLGIILGGGFWYFRNWMITGNPLFPTDFSLQGVQILDGYTGYAEKLETTSLIANIQSWGDAWNAVQKIFLMIGASAFPLIFGIILLFCLLLVYLFQLIWYRKKEYFVRLGFAKILVLTLGFYTVAYVYAPYTFQDLFPNVRYAMMLFMIGCITWAYTISRIKWLECFSIPIMLMMMWYSLWYLVINSPSEIIGNDKMVIDWGILTQHLDIILAFFASLVGILLSIGLHFFQIYRHQKYKFIEISVILLTSFGGLAWSVHASIPIREQNALLATEKWYEGSGINAQSLSIAKAAYWLDAQNISDPIAYSGFNIHYPFFGRILERSVDYVNINKCAECAYQDYKDDVNSIRTSPDFAAWKANLKNMKKKYLVIAPLRNPSIRSYEWEWATSHPNNFSLVYSENNVFIYKIQEL